MKTTFFDYADVPYINPSDLAYIKLEDRLKPFYKYKPELSQFEQVIEDKSKESIDRSLLQSVLGDQYAELKTDVTVATNQVAKLGSDTTFTVVTAHQPVLFTGPLYVVYKIISAIKLCRQLESHYPTYQFVPVFVTGGEDHDFEEMNHLRLFGKQIIWKGNQKGAVGRMSTSSLRPTLQSLKEILGDAPVCREIYELIEQCHTHGQYIKAYLDLINGLFGKYGLVVLNMDHVDLKRRMLPIFRNELTIHEGAARVRNTQAQIVESGLNVQAYVRDINLFYLTQDLRNRIEKRSDRYYVVDTDLSFTEDEMMAELENHPDRFSPNVVTRPLYQETILPNLAYIGGGGEIAYWLERKAQFEHFDINFPMLIRRDSCLWVESAVVKRMQKTDTTVSDFFLPKHEHEKKYLAKKAENEFRLGQEKGQILQLFKKIEEKANDIDPTLRSTVAAEGKNVLKVIANIEDRLRKAEKQKHDIALGQLDTIREKLFPERSLQERKDNFLNFYIRNTPEYFEILLNAFDPLDQRFKVLQAQI